MDALQLPIHAGLSAPDLERVARRFRRAVTPPPSAPKHLRPA